MCAKTSNPLNNGIPQTRHIPLNGSPNFRDIGGYATNDGRRVRWHRVYRSGQIDRISDADVGVLAQRRVLTVVDLREDDEIKVAPSRLPENAKIISCSAGKNPMTNWSHMLVGAQSGVPFMKAFYSDTHSFASRFKIYFDALLNLPDDSALLLHCMAGKDRTGIGIALLMVALGVPREAIFEDYLLTNKYNAIPFKRDAKFVSELQIPEVAIRDLLAAREEYLQAFFVALDTHHGSGEQFLAQAIGLTPEKIARLREKFTE